jgi:type IV pilus assembly protein PilM
MLVDQYIESIKAAGLNVKALELESLSICRSLLKEETPKFNLKDAMNYGLIDIGAKRTSLLLYAKQAIAMSISLPISGDEVTERISQTLEITGEQAEKAKIICGLDKNIAHGIINGILQDMITDLTGKIKESLEFYSNQFSDRGPIGSILLCGGGSNIKNLDLIIKEATGIATAPANAFINIAELPEKLIKTLEEKHDLDFAIGKNKADNISVVQNSSLSYASAIGSALRGIFINKY